MTEERRMDQAVSSECVTHAVRVRASSQYLPEHSSPDDQHFYFAYHITISNEGEQSVKLVSRELLVIDSDGQQDQVTGPGVVGQTPEIAPGETFEYTSFCPLGTRWGTLEGSFQMIRDDGDIFDVKIGRFFLIGATDEHPVAAGGPS